MWEEQGERDRRYKSYLHLESFYKNTGELWVVVS